MTDESDLIADHAVDDEECPVAAATDGSHEPCRESHELGPDTREGIVYLVGQIHANDVRRDAFRVWLGPTEYVNANLTVGQQGQITAALHDRDATLVRMRGNGHYRITGELLCAHEVEQVDLLDLDLFTPDPNAPTLSEMIDNAFADVPDEVWATLPRDLTERHDDYFAEIGNST